MNSNFNDKINPSLYSMSKRLGIFPTPPQKLKLIKDDEKEDTPVDLDGLDHMKALLENEGGLLQQERMIFDKRRSLDRALLYSYQGALVLIDGANMERPVHALMNPNKNKADYDEKILSIGYEYNVKPGDTFEWCQTKTHWLVYLQDLTELGYFRGNVRKCSYIIKWIDENGLHQTFAAVRGPVETQINFIQKHTISVDEPNFSLNILIPRNEDTLKYFRRYTKFYLSGQEEGSQEICWRIEAIDSISTPGILEINAEEYYINRDEDDVEEGIAGSLIVEPANPNSEEVEALIVGDSFINPKMHYTYTYTGTEIAEWSVDEKMPISIVPNGNVVIIKWKSNIGGTFTLKYGDLEKTIKVNSMFE